MRLALAFALIGAAVAALPAPAAADTVVRSDERIGSFRVKSDGTLGGARNAFGVPSRSVRTSDATCSVTWARLGLRIGFYNLGGLPPCGRATGHFSNAAITGAQWRTGNGLSDRRPCLAAAHPLPGGAIRARTGSAARAGGSWRAATPRGRARTRACSRARARGT